MKAGEQQAIELSKRGTAVLRQLATDYTRITSYPSVTS